MSLADRYPYYLANRPEAPNHDLEVTDKFSGEVATRVALADDAAIDRAIGRAVEAAEPMARLAAYDTTGRARSLRRALRGARRGARARALHRGRQADQGCAGRGHPADRHLSDRLGGSRSGSGGEVMPLDISPRARGYAGMWKRVPIGPCSFISPFNFPLNLAAHKVAPALGGRLPLRPQGPRALTPIGALVIGEILAETDLPRGRLLDPALLARGRRALHGGRAPEIALLYRIPGSRLGAQGEGG